MLTLQTFKNLLRRDRAIRMEMTHSCGVATHAACLDSRVLTRSVLPAGFANHSLATAHWACKHLCR
jgi:hypothetical protein